MPERTLADSRRFVLTTLAPVHIGSGKSLLPGIEIVPEPGSGRTIVLDMEEALHRLDVAKLKAATSLGIGDLLPLLKRSGVDLSEVSLHVLDGPWGGSSLQLREAIRDAGGRSLVPGSSIKGALRTAVLAAKVAESRASGRDPVAGALQSVDGRKPKFAAQKLEASFFRPVSDDPKFDVFRRLAVTDAFFPGPSLTVTRVSVNSPTPQDPARWKDFTMAVEALPPGAQAELFISLDSSLLGSAAEEKLHFGSIGLTWESLCRWARERTLAHLEEERRVLASRGHSHATGQLDRIRVAMESAPEGAIPLRLGWGIGWHGTTGGVATETQRIDLLRKFDDGGRNKMGKLGPAAYMNGLVFPKSRRLRKKEDEGASDATFGWVLLEPAGDLRIPVPEPLRRSSSVSREEAPPPPPSPPEEPQALRKVRAMLPKDFAGQMGQLVREAAEGVPSKKENDPGVPPLTEVQKEAFAAEAIKRLADLKLTKDFQKKTWYETLTGWLKK